MSLKTRIMLLVVAIFFASIWGLAIRVTAVLRTDLSRLVSNHLATMARFIAADLDREISLEIEAQKGIAAS
ncbi:MAG: hypothetical protein HYU75_03495, partial [Betaproteobacteria bacterium]|nr:hypothetical protein [Betaproteobacteria bacterium]